MPTLLTIVTEADIGQSDDELELATRGRALEAMHRAGVVDESTLELKDVGRDVTLNFGPGEDGNDVFINTRDHGLVAVRYAAQAEPHNKEGN